MGQLDDEEKALFSRMAEVYAAFSEYTDHQVGRIVDYLEESGQLDNTLIIYAADNGASGEGSPNGSVNENKFFNAWPDTIEDNLPFIDKLGGPGLLQPLPDRLGGRVLDAVPDVQALQLPGRRLRPAGDPLAGGASRRAARCAPSTTTARTSSRRSSTAAASRCRTWSTASSRRRCPACRCATVRRRRRADARRRPSTTRCSGTRGIWHKGWKAVAEHGPVPIGLGKFDQDRWQLFHTDEDRSEAHDLAEQHPEKLEELEALWLEEAEKYDVLPLNDLSIFDFRELEYASPCPTSGRYIYYPGTSEVPEASAANTLNVSLQDPRRGGVHARRARA